jgi:hypothetical protein
VRGRRSDPTSRAARHRYLYRTSTADEWPVLLPFAAILATEIAIVGFRCITGGMPNLAALQEGLTGG